jgi:hypothetical protein
MTNTLDDKDDSDLNPIRDEPAFKQLISPGHGPIRATLNA